MRKVGILILAMVIVLGSLGVGYSAWAKTLPIQGTVNTGYTDANFYGSTGATGNNMLTATAVPDADPHQLDVTVYNAYPGATITDLAFEVHNVGTVPMTVTSVVYVDGPLATFTGVAPTDASITTDGYSGMGYLSFSLVSDPNIVPELSILTFHVMLNYTVAPGP